MPFRLLWQWAHPAGGQDPETKVFVTAADGSHRKKLNQAGKEPKMKPWTTEFVTSLWASSGFDGIAELHNRELGQLKKMNNNSEEAKRDGNLWELGLPAFLHYTRVQYTKV